MQFTKPLSETKTLQPRVDIRQEDSCFLVLETYYSRFKFPDMKGSSAQHLPSSPDVCNLRIYLSQLGFYWQSVNFACLSTGGAVLELVAWDLRI